jgi:hypothetical protein
MIDPEKMTALFFRNGLCFGDARKKYDAGEP